MVWLVVSTPLKNMKVNWDDYFVYDGKIKKFQTTNQWCYPSYIYIIYIYILLQLHSPAFYCGWFGNHQFVGRIFQIQAFNHPCGGAGLHIHSLLVAYNPLTNWDAAPGTKWAPWDRSVGLRWFPVPEPSSYLRGVTGAFSKT